jgi:TonB family protein
MNAAALLLMASAIAQSAPPQSVMKDSDALVEHESCPVRSVLLSGDVERSSVEVRFEVSEGGELRSLEQLSGTGLASLDEQVLTALRQCRFSPARRNGLAVDGQGRSTVFFHPASAHPVQNDPKRPRVSCAPTESDYPAVSRKLHEHGTTTLRFSVDERGLLQYLDLYRSSGHDRLDQVSVSKIAGCQFRPGRKADGTPSGGVFVVDFVWVLQ